MSKPVSFKLLLNIEEISKNKEELKRYLGCIDTLENYTKHSLNDVEEMKKNFELIEPEYMEKMKFNYMDRINKLKEAINNTQKFLTEIVQINKPEKKYYDMVTQKDIDDWSDYDSTHLDYAVFCYMVRDWSEERKVERKIHYDMILEEIKLYLNDSTRKYKVFVPGAALCRLVYEIAQLGHEVECNDYSYHNCLISDYVFNHLKKDGCVFKPLIRSFFNYLKEDLVFRDFTLPDVDFSKSGENIGDITMTGGDFLLIYQDQKEKFDCVVTCFFIDTAKNVIEYIDTIYNMLKVGGVWINFGPLSYHWSGMEEYISIELAYDKIKECLLNYGFELKRDMRKEVDYCETEGYMLNTVYNSVFFTCIKRK